MDQARANGVDDVALLSRQEILAREPELSPRLKNRTAEFVLN